MAEAAPVKEKSFFSKMGDGMKAMGHTISEKSKALGHTVSEKSQALGRTMVHSMDDKSGREMKANMAIVDAKKTEIFNSGKMVAEGAQLFNEIELSENLVIGSVTTAKTVKLKVPTAEAVSLGIKFIEDTKTKIKALTSTKGVRPSDTKMDIYNAEMAFMKKIADQYNAQVPAGGDKVTDFEPAAPAPSQGGKKSRRRRSKKHHKKSKKHRGGKKSKKSKKLRKSKRSKKSKKSRK